MKLIKRIRAALKRAMETIREHCATADAIEAVQLAEYASYINNWVEV